MSSENPLLVLQGIKKSFGAIQVLRGIDLEVRRGEFITLLGPSGCGKTTTLRIIAGLEEADEGRVFLEGRDIGALEPDRRNIRMVFQNYALFPHMNVENNIAYSLRLKGRPRAEIRERCARALKLVQLAGFEKRLPRELSGGQKQRVALARALVSRPPVLLLDEPLGALDLQLRRKMQIELKEIQRQLGITFIYITHDQEEALSMSDRIAVMREGLFEQTGTAADVYERPLTSFAARFVGNANLLRVKLISRKTDQGNTLLVLEHPAGRVLALAAEDRAAMPEESGEELTLAVRSEYVVIKAAPSPDASGAAGLDALVTAKSFAGGQLRIGASLVGKNGEICGEITASRHGMDSSLSIGDRVRVDWEDSCRAVVVRD
ncbi:MAG: ABC transporter ATP-binding protein [Treponema sp.]|jgi:spermidine/putrescine transport system ATP-binding protein|nr:ABC transporter ATP-binding protein [Treponema sp.]